jgi:hypothetical protein
MDLIFERGSGEAPKGHALIYFRASSDPEEIWASYLVMLPITVDVAKYVPPFLMSQVGDLGPKDLSAFAFPPAPEKLEGLAHLEETAARREDDLIFGGTINVSDVTAGMMAVNEIVQRYAEMYSAVFPSQQPSEAATGEETRGLGVNEVLYGLMADGDKLSELTKLVGRLRFAAEGGEVALANEAEADIKLLASHLPENHHVLRLIAAAKAGGSRGAKLADLYLQRCFHLTREAYVKLGQVEAEIRAMEAGESSS